MYESILRCFSFQFELSRKLSRTYFSNKGIVNVDFWLTVAAALVILMDNNFLYQIMKHMLPIGQAAQASANFLFWTVSIKSFWGNKDRSWYMVFYSCFPVSNSDNEIAGLHCRFCVPPH